MVQQDLTPEIKVLYVLSMHCCRIFPFPVYITVGPLCSVAKQIKLTTDLVVARRGGGGGGHVGGVGERLLQLLLLLPVLGAPILKPHLFEKKPC